MPEGREEIRIQRWIGPALVVLVVLVAGAFLEAAADKPGEEWFVRAFLVIGLLSTVGYVMLVHIPARRNARDLRALRQSCDDQSVALGEMLTQLRYGDMVSVADRDGDLPEDLHESVTAASRTLAALIQQIQSSSVEVATAAGTVQ